MLSLALRRASASASRRSALLLSAQRGFASSYPPHEVVGLPALSPTMEQGNLASWRLKEGDKISAGDIICQIETDKAVVDFEAQDDMFLAKILVPEGTENINIGQPIMVTCEEEEDVAALKDFKVEDSDYEVAAPAPKSPEELPPKKEEVVVDSESQAPVVPQDFLVASQTTQKGSKGPSIPESPAPAKPAKAAAPAPAAEPADAPKFAEKWGQGMKKSPLSASLVKKQQAYIDLYGITGTTPPASM